MRLIAAIILAFLPDRQSPPAEQLTPPPLVENYTGARIEFDGDLLTVEMRDWFGSGHADADGRIALVWLSKPSGNVVYLGRYWFDEEGRLVGVYRAVESDSWGADRCYVRLAR